MIGTVILLLVCLAVVVWFCQKDELIESTSAVIEVRPPMKHTRVYLRVVTARENGFNLAEALREALDYPEEVDAIHKALLANVSGPLPGQAFKSATYADEKYRIYASLIQEPWFETTTMLRVEYLTA